MRKYPFLQDDDKYFIQYQEPGFADDEWVRYHATRPYPTFQSAYDDIVKLQDTHKQVKFRIEQEIQKRVILWSMKDGDE